MPRPFPMVSLLVEGKRCLVIGGGQEALGRVDELLAAGALVRVVALRVEEALRFRAAELELCERAFAVSDLLSCYFVVNTSRDAVLAAQVFAATREAHIFLATLDDPARSDLGFAAVARVGLLRIGVSTGGASPALARRLREELERIFCHPRTERLLLWLSKSRETLRQTETSMSARGDKIRATLVGLSLTGELTYPDAFLKEDE